MFIKLKKGLLICLAFITVFVAVLFLNGTKTQVFAIDNQKRALGVDVSVYNGDIDWEAAKNAGLDFAIIRIGYGDDFENQDDKKAIQNMIGCEAAGVPYGVYIYSYALTEAEVDSEIAHTLRMISGYNPQLGIWFDMEDADSYKNKHGMNPYTHGEQLTNFCIRYINGIKKAGYSIVGVYANYDYFNNVLDYDLLCENGYIWYAHWGISEPKMTCDMWQYTNLGSIKGIPATSEGTDMDIIYPDSPLYSIVAGKQKEESSVEPSIEEPSTNPETPTYHRGDVNGDGEIDIIDLAIIKKSILGKTTLTGEKATRADVNNDGNIDIIDLAQVKKHILKKINLFEK